MTDEQTENKLIEIENIIKECHNVRDVLEETLIGAVQTRTLGKINFTVKQKQTISNMYKDAIKKLKNGVNNL